jgi:hypothetical protein
MAYLITEQAAASVHTLAALVAYTWQEHKPSLHLTQESCDLSAKAF